VKKYTKLLFALSCFVSFSQEKSINEAKFVEINGMEQWVTIQGDDTENPMILFVHGGPGSTMSQFENSMFKGWEKEFVLVNWDQRGAGRTYGKNAPSENIEEFWVENPLTVEQMVEDGIALTKYLLKHLKKEKIIIISTSWGSILGTKMVLDHPELFRAYIGHSQFVNFSDNISSAYQKTLQLAQQENDTESLNMLNAIGAPPYDSAKTFGQSMRVVKKYEAKNSTAPPDGWFNVASEYDNEKDAKHRYEGDDYSFIYFAGHKKLNIASMAANIDFSTDATHFKIPVYYVQGAEDILTSKEVNKPYFEKIEAPTKDYFLIPNAAHGFNEAVVDKLYEILTKHL
jgi:pimeloyl-ACP methyl ester carboxylesterase